MLRGSPQSVAIFRALRLTRRDCPARLSRDALWEPSQERESP